MDIEDAVGCALKVMFALVCAAACLKVAIIVFRWAVR
jgi:hypothetical protein